MKGKQKEAVVECQGLAWHGRDALLSVDGFVSLGDSRLHAGGTAASFGMLVLSENNDEVTLGKLMSMYSLTDHDVR